MFRYCATLGNPFAGSFVLGANEVPLDTKLIDIIKACQQGKAAGQRELYQQFYSYGMKVCVRYAQHEEEAREILNDSFVKVFQKISTHYDLQLSFKAWLNKILVRTAIDYYRKRQHAPQTIDVTLLHVSYEADTLDHLSAQEILSLVQTLPPAYRMAFNLYAIEGYKHHEIAEMLGITEGTSKSNLAKARKHLQAKIHQLHQEKNNKYG